MSCALVILTAIVLTAPIVQRILRGRVDPFEPVVVFFAAWGTMFVLRPAAMLLTGNLEYARPTRSIPIGDTFAEALLLGLLGAVAFLGAYEARAGQHVARRLPQPAAQFRTRTVVSAALLAAAVAVGSFLVFLAQAAKLAGVSGLMLFFSGRSTAMTQASRTLPAYLGQASVFLTPATLALYAIGRARGSRVLLAVAAVTGATAILRAAPGGSRMMLLPLFGGLIVYHYTTNRRRPRWSSVAILAIVAALLSAIIVNTRESSVRVSHGFGLSVAEVLTDPSKLLAPFLEGGDTEMAPALAAVLTVVPETIPYSYGRGLVGDLLTRPIPRQIWSGKPRAPREQVIALLWPDEVDVLGIPVANPEFSVLLHFYLDFGVPGVMVGMALLGVIARAGYDYYRLHARSTLARLLFALGVPFLVIALRDSPVDVINRAGFTILPLWVMFRLGAVGRRRGLGGRERGGAPELLSARVARV